LDIACNKYFDEIGDMILLHDSAVHGVTQIAIEVMG
jgi:hypothetical protein